MEAVEGKFKGVIDGPQGGETRAEIEIEYGIREVPIEVIPEGLEIGEKIMIIGTTNLVPRRKE